MNKIRHNYANVVNVTGTREEIDIRFGKTLGNPYFHEQPQVQATNRITLSPFVAKRLAILLDSTMKEYEARYGFLGKGSETSEIVDISIDLLPATFRTRRTEKEGGLLIDLMKSLDIEVGFERSLKLFTNTILTNRFLAGFRRNIANSVMDDKILEVCRGINMPADFVKSFQEDLPGANIVLFGFEEQKEKCVYKAYLEFGNRFGNIFRYTPDTPNPFILHTGYKWDTLDNNIKAIAQYKCFPGIPVKAMLERLSNSFYIGRGEDLLETVSDLLDRAMRSIEPYEILYLEVEEENNPRRSFDINIYRANLTLETLYPLLLRIFTYFSIPAEVFLDLYEPVKDQIFGHLSGGIDREGKDFLTIYFGVKGSSRLP